MWSKNTWQDYWLGLNGKSLEEMSKWERLEKIMKQKRTEQEYKKLEENWKELKVREIKNNEFYGN